MCLLRPEQCYQNACKVWSFYYTIFLESKKRCALSARFLDAQGTTPFFRMEF